MALDSGRRGALISRSRKIRCIVALAVASSGALAAWPSGAPAAPAPGAAGGNLVRAGLRQAGRSLIASIRTARPVALAKLDPLPQSPGARFLCLQLIPRARAGARRICLGGKRPHRSAGLQLVNGSGRVLRSSTVSLEVKRPDPRKLVVTLVPAEAGLTPQPYEWRVLEGPLTCPRRPPAPGAGEAARGCVETLPAGGRYRVFRLRPVRAVGCTGAAAVLNTNGPRDRNVVALTFDDGPSEFTPGFLDVLRAKHAVGTFFEIGQEMPGRESVMRRILREGDEIGNHTMHHAFYPGYSEIAPDSRLIEAATHFKPCLFRPPGGGVDSSVISTAAELGMRTITWDVDPTDWANPGSAAVYSRIVSAAQPGSIILMHDGGGDRSGTLAALPAIIDTLRSRGYRFATVSELLGDEILYRPYG